MSSATKGKREIKFRDWLGFGRDGKRGLRPRWQRRLTIEGLETRTVFSVTPLAVDHACSSDATPAVDETSASGDYDVEQTVGTEPVDPSLADALDEGETPTVDPVTAAATDAVLAGPQPEDQTVASVPMPGDIPPYMGLPPLIAGFAIHDHGDMIFIEGYVFDDGPMNEITVWVNGLVNASAYPDQWGFFQIAVPHPGTGGMLTATAIDGTGMQSTAVVAHLYV